MPNNSFHKNEIASQIMQSDIATLQRGIYTGYYKKAMSPGDRLGVRAKSITNREHREQRLHMMIETHRTDENENL